MPEIVDERIETAGFTSHVLHAGQGASRAVVVLHGGGPGAQAVSNWMPTLTGMSERVHVIAPDLVGFGSTDHPDASVRGPEAYFDLRIEQILGLADHFGYEKVDLVGNSLGGGLALRFALKQPDRLDRLILMGSAGAPMNPPLPGLIQLFSFDQDPSKENLGRILQSFVYDLSRFGEVDELVEERIGPATDPVVRRSWHNMFHDEDDNLAAAQLALPPEKLATIPHETLVVHGRDDKIIPVDGSRYLMENIPNADLHIFSRCGHWAMLEQPDRFNRLVLDFVLEAERTPVA